MKNNIYLLVLLLFLGFLSVADAQISCQPTSVCADAPLVCGFVLNGFTGNNNVPPGPPVQSSCGIDWHNSVWFRVVPCGPSLDLVVIPSNCQSNNGLQVGLYADCDPNTAIACNPGVMGGGNFPLNLSAPVTQGEIYYLQIDGYEGDVCDFQVVVLNGLDPNPPLPAMGNQTSDGYIEGPATVCRYESPIYSVHLPVCELTSPGSGCDILDTTCLQYVWSLPPGAVIVGNSTGPDVQIDMSNAQSGTISVAVENNCTACEGCAAGVIGCDNGIIEPLVVTIIDPVTINLPNIGVCSNNWPPNVTADLIEFFGSSMVATDYDTVQCQAVRQTYFLKPDVQTNLGVVQICPGDTLSICNDAFTVPGAFLSFCTTADGCDSLVQGILQFKNCAPPDTCANYNMPTAPGDSCQNAPLLCGNFLNGYCSNNGGYTASSPHYAPGFTGCDSTENDVWLRFSPCESTVEIKITAKNCQGNDGLTATFMGGDCDSLALVACGPVLPDVGDLFIINNLVPTEVYWLMIDGKDGDVCEFTIETMAGIGTALPGTPSCSCADGSVQGDNALCPGETATYTVSWPVCTVTSGPPVGGNGLACAPAIACPSNGADSTWLVWHIPSSMHFIGDSTGLTVQLGVDSALIGVDTLIMDSIWVEFFSITLPDSSMMDSTIFCTCNAVGCVGKINGLPITIQHQVIFDASQTLTCTVPSVVINGQTVSQPGIYLAAQSLCETHFTEVTASFVPPSAFGLTEVELGGGNYLVSFSVSPSFVLVNGMPVNGQFTSPPIPCGAPYFFLLTDPQNGCEMPIFGQLNCNSPCPFIAVNVTGAGTTLNCCNPSTVLQAFANQPTVFTQWIGPNAGQGNTLTATQPGSYTVVVTDQDGCTGQASVLVNADFAQPTVLAQAQTPICIGAFSTVLATSPNTPNAVFNWQNGASGPSLLIAPNATTTYNVICTNPTNCCTAQAAATVEVQPFNNIQHGVVGTITCTTPCVTFMGQSFCTPGVQILQNGCDIEMFTINAAKDTVALGLVATLTCNTPCFTRNGIEYCQAGAYTDEDNCTVYHFDIMEIQKDTVALGVVATLTCTAPCFTRNGVEYCQAGSYSDEANCTVYYFDIMETPKDTLTLGLVATLTCSAPTFSRNGQTYAQPGAYSDEDLCSVYHFDIAADQTQPTVMGLQQNCLPSNVAYEVIFNVSGQAPFNVNGVGLPGSVFVSAPIMSGQPYVFVVKSVPNGCETTVNGVHDCNFACVTTAGTMSPEPLHICETALAQAVSLGGEFMDADDTMAFVMHSSPDVTLGAVLAQNATGVFSFLPATMQLGTTYYLSKMVGNDNGAGMVDLNDPCLAIAPGQPVIFKKNPELMVTGNVGVCAGETLTLSATGADDIAWQMPDGMVASGAVLEKNNLTDTDAGRYVVKGTNNNGCAANVDVTVEVLSVPSGFDLTITTPPCGAAGAGSMEVLNVAVGTPPFTYTLDGAPGSMTNIFENLATGIHALEVTGLNGCEADTLFEIAASEPLLLDLGGDHEVAAGSPVTLIGATNGVPTEILWTTNRTETQNDSLTWVLVPLDDRFVYLHIRDSAGCTASDSVWIRIAEDKPTFVPNVFSPNGDDTNDTFGLLFDSETVQVDMRIYSRWGQEMFHGTSAKDHWNGQFRGKAAAAEVYVYVIVLTNAAGEEKRLVGDVLLVR